MAKMWAGRTDGVTDKIADDFNSSISFDSRMYKQDITGSMAHAAMLAKRGIRARLVNASTVKPLDEKLLREIADKPVFTLEEHVRTGGFGAAVCGFLTENGFAAPAKVFALPDAFVTHGSRNLLLDKHGLSPEKIADEVVNTLQKK